MKSVTRRTFLSATVAGSSLLLLGACELYAGIRSPRNSGGPPDLEGARTGNGGPVSSGNAQYVPASSDTTPRSLSPSAKPDAPKEFLWKHYGGDPWLDPKAADPSGFEEGIALLQKTEKLPQEVVDRFRTLVREKRGADGTLKKGDRLTAMLSGRGGKRHTAHVYRNVVVAFYQTVATKEYEVDYENYIYTLVEPITCSNWSLRPVVKR